MGVWWKPTAEGYFKHVAKAAILEAVGEFAPKHVNQLAKLKKTDIASEAERLVEGTGWMPAVFTTGQGAEPQAVQEVAEEPEPTAADEAHGHTLAARCARYPGAVRRDRLKPGAIVLPRPVLSMQATAPKLSVVW